MGPTPSFEEPPLLDFSTGFVESPEFAWPVGEDPLVVVLVVCELRDELPLDIGVRLALVVGLPREDPEAEVIRGEAEEITDPDDPLGEATVPN